MKLIVGLGNPGFKYRNTKHNLGFLVIKELSKELGISVKKRKYNGLLGKGALDQEDISLFMPQTYMNLSGQAVLDIVKKSRLKLENLLVICDDINLEFGFIRLRGKGSHGGHNGLESVISSLGSSDFPRLRIGIGRAEGSNNTKDFVLSRFNAKERLLLKDIIKEAKECVLTWLNEGLARAMTAFNKRQNA